MCIDSHFAYWVLGYLGTWVPCRMLTNLSYVNTTDNGKKLRACSIP